MTFTGFRLLLQDYSARFPADRYCGGMLGNRVPGSIVTYSRPHLMRVVTDDEEPKSGVASNDRGFDLKYFQIPCSASRMDAINFT